MKQLLILFFLLSNSLFSQSGGMGIHYQTKSDDDTFRSVFTFNIDGKTKSKYIFGMEIGANLFGVSERLDYTETINIDQYPEDITGEYVYNLFKFGYRIGYEFKDNLNLIASVGLNFMTEYQLRFDESHILGDNGNYAIETGENKTVAYFKGSISYFIHGFSPEIGYGTDGVSFGLTYYW